MTATPKLDRIHFFHPGLETPPAAKEVLGGKGHSLAAMSRAGLPVPPGFTLATDGCRAYHEAGGEWPEGLEAEVRRALEWLELQTGRALGRGPRPLFVAVRSGAAVSMPGMMDTILNVGMHAGLEEHFTDKEGFRKEHEDFTRAFRKTTGKEVPADGWDMLVAAISAVFESWNSERARRYRARNDVRGPAGTAVTVQAMFPSQRSGILFTQDPTRPDADRIVIEASAGLGEAIVQGQVDPDVYVVARADKTIAERRAAGPEPCLTDVQIVELADLGLRIEAHFGTPVDLEWGLADGRFTLLQSRPVRGLDVARDVPAARQEEIARLRAQVNGRKKTWAVHNLGETLPAPTPLTWDIIGRGFMSDGFVELYRSLGFKPSDRVRREGFLELIAGRIYADADRAAELYFDSFPLEYDLESGGRPSELLLARPTKFNVERAGLGFLLRLPFTLFRMTRAGRVLRRTARNGLEDLEKRILPAFTTYVEKARSTRLADLPDEALFAALEERERVALNGFGSELMKPGYLAGYYHGRLSEALEQILGPDEGRAMTAKLLMGLDGDKTIESNIALSRVARGELDMKGYLAEFGHRAVNELELAEPRWREDDSYLQARVKQLRGASGPSPAERLEAQKQVRRAAEESLGPVLRGAAAASLEEDVRADLEGAQKHMPYRETCKHYFMMSVALVREAIEVLADRWDLGRDVYFLQRAELRRFPEERDALRESIGKRNVRWKALQRLQVPDLLRSEDLDALGREEEVVLSAKDVLAGTSVAAGIGTGPARILSSPADAGDLGTGYVLVCPTTDPSWTPLFVHAAGLVVERGGMLSHGAIVARDFGIPAVVLPHATRLLAEGGAVRVDGNRGRVERVKE